MGVGRDWGPPRYDDEPEIALDRALFDPSLRTGDGPAELERLIVDDPDDLDARRVLSDALLERGDPRGEYIRLALQLDGLASWHDEHAPLSRAVAMLEARHAQRWLAGARRAVSVDSRPELRRGVVERLRASSADDLSGAMEVAPIRGATLQCDRLSASRLAELAASPSLSRLRELTLEETEEESIVGQVPALLAALERLEELRLHIQPAFCHLVDALCASPALASLRTLHLDPDPDSRWLREAGWERLGANGLMKLLRAPALGGLTSLERLRITQQAVGREGIEALAELPALRDLELEDLDAGHVLRLAAGGAFAGLERLSLPRGTIDPKEVARFGAPLSGLRALRLGIESSLQLDPREPFLYLLRSLPLPELRELTIDLQLYARWEEVAEQLAELSPLPRLRSLDLSGTGLDGRAAAALARSRAFPRLTRLALRHTQIGHDGLGALLGGPLTEAVRELSVSHQFRSQIAQLGDPAGAAIARWSCAPRLRSLALSAHLAPECVEELVASLEDIDSLNLKWANPVPALLRSDRISGLRELEVWRARTEQIVDLARSDVGQGLERLTVFQTRITRPAAQQLAELPCLQRLAVDRNEVSPVVVPTLRERFGVELQLV